jgi:beta-aspartyl-peptidase (threonine type)
MRPTVNATILVHAGAGGWGGNETRKASAQAACVRAVERGREVLGDGGSAADAALAAVVILEDDPCCNAGTGAVVNSDGVCELDACVMDGRTLTSGAVGALQGFRNPILIAEDVRRDGRYHLLVETGAAAFARDRGWVPDAVEAGGPAHDLNNNDLNTSEQGNTVGAVALDTHGGLAAATSTGGVPGQPPGRIGDTPIVGAGTYADERAACSCTGDGESFVRACTAFWAVERSADPADDVAVAALDRTLNRFGGGGGLILLKQDGTWAARHTTAAMPWARASLEGPPSQGH